MLNWKVFYLKKDHLMNSCNDANFWNRTFNVKLLCSINFTHLDNLSSNFLDPISDYKRNIISVDCTFPFLNFFAKWHKMQKKLLDQIMYIKCEIKRYWVALFCNGKWIHSTKQILIFFAESWHLKRIFSHFIFLRKILLFEKDVLVSESNYKPIWMKTIGRKWIECKYISGVIYRPNLTP